MEFFLNEIYENVRIICNNSHVVLSPSGRLPSPIMSGIFKSGLFNLMLNTIQKDVYEEVRCFVC